MFWLSKHKTFENIHKVLWSKTGTKIVPKTNWSLLDDLFHDVLGTLASIILVWALQKQFIFHLHLAIMFFSFLKGTVIVHKFRWRSAGIEVG